jgi:hypothetical protein
MDEANVIATPGEVNQSLSSPAPEDRGYGAYGLELIGLPHADLLVPVPSSRSWPTVRVLSRLSAGDDGPGYADPERADVALPDGERVLIDREEQSATFLLTSREDDGRIVHPHLTAPGTVFAWWQGREAFHAGGLVTPAGAWALLGERGAGKSSLLAGLALAGRPILTDDVLVIDGELALAGPRCVDLRENALGPNGLEGMTSSVRGGRHRLRLGPVEPEVPLRGWVLLSWGDDLDLRPLSPTERIELLSAQRNVQGAVPDSLLRLARLPAWELQRPPDWATFEHAIHTLLELAVD